MLKNSCDDNGTMIVNEMKTFIDAFYECCDRVGYDDEEDQKLPPRKTLEEVCRILLHVSCMREEGRFPYFRVCFIDPDSAFLDAYIYAHVLRFEKPVSFTAAEINKLAPALNADMSYLVLDVREKQFKAIGILAAYTTWEKIMARELASGIRMPRIPNILVNGPGELKACFGETLLVNYHFGDCIFFRTDTFTSTLVADRLREGSLVRDEERIRVLYRILWHAARDGHGGAILIVPTKEACRGYVDLKYHMRVPFLFSGEENTSLSGKRRDKESASFADMVAKLTSVDGIVVLTKDLDLLGFGGEILVDRMDNTPPDMCFVDHNNMEERGVRFTSFGMRHRSCYRFCDTVEGAVAIIISQDGVMECCTKHDGRVVVYDHIALPTI